MVGRNGAFDLLIGAAVGTLFLSPAHGLAQADVLRLDPCDSSIIYMSRLEGLISCAETGYELQTSENGPDPVHPWTDVRRG